MVRGHRAAGPGGDGGGRGRCPAGADRNDRTGAGHLPSAPVRHRRGHGVRRRPGDRRHQRARRAQPARAGRRDGHHQRQGARHRRRTARRLRGARQRAVRPRRDRHRPGARRRRRGGGGFRGRGAVRQRPGEESLPGRSTAARHRGRVQRAGGRRIDARDPGAGQPRCLDLGGVAQRHRGTRHRLVAGPESVHDPVAHLGHRCRHPAGHRCPAACQHLRTDGELGRSPRPARRRCRTR